METIISFTSRIGFSILRQYFIQKMETEDLTNKQIVDIFQEKIDTVQKDLQVLKLQKLRSAAYLFKCGVSMFEEGDFEESKRNFDKAEADAIEGFTTAPDLNWKELATKISISSHIWRKVILIQYPNIDAVIKQILLHLQRLSDDDIIKNNIRTHLDPSYGFMRKINEEKRKDIIKRFLMLHQNCKQILFDNFLEILPSMAIEYQPGKNVNSKTLAIPYSQGSAQNDLVPYSPNQCKVASHSPLIKSWKNVQLDCEEGMLIMVAHGIGYEDIILYSCHRMSYELPGNINPIKKWFIYPCHHSTEFETVFLSINIKYTVVKTPVMAKVILNDTEFFITSDYRDASHVGSWIDLHEEYFRRHDIIKMINEGIDKVVLEISVSEVVDIASVTLSIHQRRKQIVCKGVSGLTNIL